MTMLRIVRNERGFAFAVLILVTLAVASLTGAAMVLGTNSRLISNAHERQDMLETVADDGLEGGRALLNSNPALYPDTGGYTELYNGPAFDANGQPIQGVTLSIYAGPVGITSGQYGVYGAIVSVARDGGRGIAVRRSQIMQESFSRYAYFTDIEPSNIAFGSGDQIFGPVHSNDDIKIYSSGATFHKEVTTAGVVADTGQFRKSYGTFLEGVREKVPRIDMPQTAEFARLRVQAQAGGTAFTATSGNPTGRARLRIEFVAIDLNGDGDVRDADEGFIRVYQSNDANWVVGAAPIDDLKDSETCGHFHGSSPKTFVSAKAHTTHNYGHTWLDALKRDPGNDPRCFLGGDSTLFNEFRANDGKGSWLQWTGPVDPRLNGRADRNYLFPITRLLNPNFKGVIFVDGDVAISGVLRGRVTLAATGNIIIADDITYATDPSVGTCDDILGLFSQKDIVIANTPINAPWKPSSGSDYTTYDDTKDEWVHAFVLALNQFWVQDYDSGSKTAEKCEGTNWGRGCLYLTGGIVQRTRGAVGTTGGTGYLKRYSYDHCGVAAPPPYFPTTGRFARAQYFDVDPADFGDAESYFQKLQAGI